MLTGRPVGAALAQSMRWRALIAAVIAASSVTAAADEWVTLGRIRRQMAANQERLPNYTCLETITRSASKSPGGPLERSDVVRVEVAQVDGREMYAWPGSRGFDERPLAQMIGSGTVATGDFSSHARSVFLGLAPTFTWRGEEMRGGRRVLRYDYSISLLNSGYHLNTPAGAAVVSQRGTLWADAESHELLELTIEADDIPFHLGIASVKTNIRYEQMRIGTSDFLLPRSGELWMARRDGSAMRNEIEFTRCRQYGADSVVSFDAEDDPAARMPARPTASPREVRLPAGLSVEVTLDAPLDSQVASVGDLVRAIVARDVKNASGLVLLPKGAVLSGRIRHLAAEPSGYFAIGLEFSEVEWSGAHARFSGRLAPFAELSGSRRTLPGTQRSVESDRQVTINEIPGVSTLRVLTARLRLPRGYRMRWETLPAP